MKNEEVTLILAGGNLSLPFLENVIKEHAGATIIAADRGLEACMKLQIEPDYVIGDFDSLDEQVKDAFLADRRNVTKLNPIKDDTDSEAALHLAFEKTKGVCFPYEFTLLSNLKPQIAREKYLRNICVTSLVFFGNTFILT